MNGKEIRLDLSIAEINQILEALGQLSYHQVYQLVNKIQLQATQQLQEEEGKNENEESASQYE